MQITEIYKSLQGESTYAGLACVFVRLTGCNLRCSWCDSEYTFQGGRKMAIEEVLEEVSRLSPGGGLVEITGGEPMLQEREVVSLMQRLLDDGYKVLLETSGERPLARVPAGVVKIVDVKCPDSGEADTFCMENLETLVASRRNQVCAEQPGGLRFRAGVYAPAQAWRAGECSAVFAGVSQGCDRRARQFALSARSAGTGGVDDCGQRSGAAGIAAA